MVDFASFLVMFLPDFGRSYYALEGEICDYLHAATANSREGLYWQISR
jgi:hypothetical protein